MKPIEGFKAPSELKGLQEEDARKYAIAFLEQFYSLLSHSLLFSFAHTLASLDSMNNRPKCVDFSTRNFKYRVLLGTSEGEYDLLINRYDSRDNQVVSILLTTNRTNDERAPYGNISFIEQGIYTDSIDAIISVNQVYNEFKNDLSLFRQFITLFNYDG